MRRLLVGMSGSTGSIYGVRLLEVLRDVPDVETHLVVSPAARLTVEYEVERPFEQVAALADVVEDYHDVGAGPASGTYLTMGMIVAPCSMKTLSAIATSYTDSLLTRAADVCLKERRPLVLLARETPLHLGHLRLMVQATEAGAIILPPMPGFYIRPKTVMDLVDHTLGKALDLLGIQHALYERWAGLPKAPPE